MRDEATMFELILNYAKKDHRVRAVYLNGSRANPMAKKDIFQDYDVVYVVTETLSFISDHGWNRIFGTPIIIQEPDMLDHMQEKEVDYSKRYAYLMQFTDGNRIDLTLETLEENRKNYGKDPLTVPLLDKDHLLPPVLPPSDEIYHIKKPTFGDFFSRCNNFWWVAPYCAKGLWRQEILYAADIINHYVREDLLTLVSWQVGFATDFSISLGKSYKLLKQYVDETLWNSLMKTYDLSTYESAWKALFTMCEIFTEIAPKIAEKSGFKYNREEAVRSFEFIKHIQQLPQNAENIY